MITVWSRTAKSKNIEMNQPEEQETPPAFCCPIQLDLMKDPVFLVEVFLPCSQLAC